MCLYPRLIKNRKYTVNKKNGGNVPAILDDRVKYVPIGCQNCIECRKQKSREWQVRLLEDIKHNTNGKFVTLTFSTIHYQILLNEIREKNANCKGYDLDNEIATLAMKRFRERYRKHYKKSIRHWMVTELGHQGTENIHLHGIIWTDIDMNTIEKIWMYGFMWKGKEVRGRLQNYINPQTVSYMTKYVTKMDLIHTTYKPIILTSPGIGKGYTDENKTDWQKNKYNGEKTIETYRTSTGHKISLPIYWRNKIYTEEEREKLWLQKLDKEERWIRGERVSIKEGYDEYDKILEWHRAQNKRLGYGDDTRDYEKEIYERERRILMQKTRLNKANIKYNLGDNNTGFPQYLLPLAGAKGYSLQSGSQTAETAERLRGGRQLGAGPRLFLGY